MNQYDIDTSVDGDNLDIEWLNQSKICSKYGKLYAKAKKELAKAEEQVKFIRSQIIVNIYKGIYGDALPTKPTAQLIEAHYRTQPEYLKAKEQWIEEIENEALLEQAMFAINQKKVSLSNLVHLMTVDYFSTPTEPRNLSREQKENIENHRKETMHQEINDNYRSRRTKKS